MKYIKKLIQNRVEALSNEHQRIISVIKNEEIDKTNVLAMQRIKDEMIELETYLQIIQPIKMFNGHIQEDEPCILITNRKQKHFNSIKEASIDTGFTPNKIITAIKHKTHICGFYFKLDKK